MTVYLSPVGGAGAQFFSNNGVPLSGGKIYTYAAGTTTPQATYTTSAGSAFHTNPIVLDSAGRVPNGGEIWLLGNVSYKFVLKTSADVLIATYDNLIGINSNFFDFINDQEVQVATANQTVFTLTTMQYQPGTNSLSVFVDGVNQYGPGALYAYEETSSTTVTFTAGLHVGAQVKFSTTQLQNPGTNLDASQIAYDPPFTGSVATNVEAKLAQTVSVKDFGAVGDGVTDDTAAIQAAVDAIANSTSGFYGETTGKNLLFPAGVYKLTAAIDVPTNAGIQFLGEGKTRSTVWQSTVDENIFNLTGNNFRGGFTGMRLTGVLGQVGGPSKAINIGPNGNQIDVVDCWLNTTGYGIYGNPSSDSSFTGNVVEFCLTPIYLGGAGNQQFTISGNTFYNCGPVSQGASEQRASFEFQSTNNVIFTGNRFNSDALMSPQSAGYFVLNGVSSFIFSDNEINGTQLEAQTFTVSSSTDIKFVNSIIFNSKKNQFSFADCTDVLISGNTIYGLKDTTISADNIISFDNCSKVNISNNTLGASAGYGIYANNGCSELTIANNIIDGGTNLNLYAYVFVTNAENINISGNKFINDVSSAPDVSMDTSHNVVITDNVFDNGLFIDPGVYAANVFGNIGGSQAYLNAAPIYGTWAVGNKVWFTTPTSAGYIGAVCTVAGSPGTWKTFGLIS